MNTAITRLGAVVVLGLAGVCSATATARPESARRADGPPDEFATRYAAVRNEGQPKEGANAAALVVSTAARLKDLTAASVAKRFPRMDSDRVHFLALSFEDSTAESRQQARVILADLLASDLPAKLAELAAAPRWETPLDAGLLKRRNLPDLAMTRAIARFQSGRMALARERGDRAGWLVPFREVLVLRDMVMREPDAMAALNATAIDAILITEVLNWLASGSVDDAALKEFAAVMAQHPAASALRVLRGERVKVEEVIEFVSWTGEPGFRYIMDPTQDQMPPRPAERVVKEGAALNELMPARLEHIRVASEFFDLFENLAGKPASERFGAQVKARDALEQKSMLLSPLGIELGYTLTSLDTASAQQRGVLVLAALERHRLAKGKYPETLAELVPAFMAELPTDPYTGKSFGYLPPARGPYAGGRAFVLYAAGNDGVDNGGKVSFDNPDEVNKRGSKGGDYLLNQVSPDEVKTLKKNAQER